MDRVALAKSLGSPILPFCCGINIQIPNDAARSIGVSYLPLGESQLSLAATLGNNSLLLLQAAADGTAGNGQVAVVAMRSSVFPVAQSCIHRRLLRSGSNPRRHRVARTWEFDIRETGSFPGRHGGGIVMRVVKIRDDSIG